MTPVADLSAVRKGSRSCSLTILFGKGGNYCRPPPLSRLGIGTVRVQTPMGLVRKGKHYLH